MKGQWGFYFDLLPGHSNSKIVQFWQDFGQFLPKNADVSKDSVFLETRYKIHILTGGNSF